MMACDPDSLSDKETILELTAMLKSKIDSFCGKHLNSGSRKQIQEMSVAVEQVRNHEQEGIIGGIIGSFCTISALKNETSYMIGTECNGIKLIERGRQIYSGRLPVYDALLTDIIYIKSQNCYLLNYDEKVYRKDIDGRPPYLWMEIFCGLRPGASFRFSEVNDKLVVNKDEKNVSVICFERKEVELEVEKGDIGEFIWDFRIFGEQENKVVSLTKDGFLLLYKLDLSKRTGSVVSSHQIELIEERRELAASVVVCSENQYLCVEVESEEHPNICSRVLVFGICQNTQRITLKASIDQCSQKIGSKYALTCLGYAGCHLLWIGLSRSFNQIVQVYDFDTESEEFRELKERRIEHQEYDPFKVHRVGAQFFYTGKCGKFMRLRVTL